MLFDSSVRKMSTLRTESENTILGNESKSGDTAHIGSLYLDGGLKVDL